MESYNKKHLQQVMGKHRISFIQRKTQHVWPMATDKRPKKQK